MLRPIAIIFLVALALPAQDLRLAVAREPVSAILDAFQEHDIIALAEGEHRNQQSAAFRLEFIRDPRFPAVVNDVVVESGSARYQDTIDRFVRGETVSDAELRHVWQDTSQPDATWDVPLYEEFFRAVRQLNAALPRERQLRILLGDPPVDWDSTRTREDWIGLPSRDAFAAGLIQHEVLSKHRRALLVWGYTHFLKRPLIGSSLVTRLEESCAGCVFAIWTHTGANDLQTLLGDVAGWREPSFALTKGTALGAAAYSFISSKQAGGSPAADGPRLEEEFDALLYLGPPSALTYAQIAPSLCADAAYLKMRLSENGPHRSTRSSASTRRSAAR